MLRESSVCRRLEGRRRVRRHRNRDAGIPSDRTTRPSIRPFAVSEKRTGAGVVVFDDDRPVAEANITAAPIDHPGVIMGSTRANSSGAFDLRLLAGVSYLVRAGIRTESGFRQTEATVYVDQQLEDLRLSIERAAR